MQPPIVVVGGVHKGAGKTTVACHLLGQLAGWGALKVTTTHEGTICPVDAACTTCGEVKGPFEVVVDPGILWTPGTDTWKLARAGARRVVWLRATAVGLEAGLVGALARLDDLPGVVVEGTNAARYLDGIYVLAARPPVRKIKPSARDTAALADLTVLNLPRGWVGGGLDLLHQELPIFRVGSLHFRGDEPRAAANAALADAVQEQLRAARAMPRPVAR
jgi:molybdopterin-guanine dinucleotide biosynthesis protein